MLPKNINQVIYIDFTRGTIEPVSYVKTVGIVRNCNREDTNCSWVGGKFNSHAHKHTYTQYICVCNDIIQICMDII